MTIRRAYPEAPIVAVGAVVMDHDSVLLVQRGREPQKGAWTLPGGAVELGETLEQAVRREVLEETGLEVEPLRMIEVLDGIHRDSHNQVAYHYVLIDFACEVLGGVLCCGSDALEARWVSSRDLPAEDLDEASLAVILKALH